MSVGRRLTQVEAQLPPREAVLHWLTPLLVAADHGEYAALRLGATEGWAAILKHARERARERARGMSRQEIEAAERAALKDTRFLLELADHVNKDAVERWEARRLRTMLLLTMTECLPLVAIHTMDIQDADPLHERWWHSATREPEATRKILTEACGALLAPRLAVEQLSQRYFAGHPILFAGAREQLALGQDSFQMLVDAYDVTIQWLGGDRFDATATREEAMSEQVRMFVDFARMDTLTYLGEEWAADQIFQRYRQLLCAPRADGPDGAR